MAHASTIILTVFEDAFFTWTWNNSPTLVIIGILMWFTWWTRGQLNAISNRFNKLESDYRQVDKRMDSFDKKLKSFDKRLTRIERKLDKLIVHLTSTKKIDSGIPLQ